jgi:histidinol-phosphate aminotransferase
MNTIEQLARPNIRALKGYSSARQNDALGRKAYQFMDANESPFDNGVNRYPDPHLKKLKQSISKLKGLSKNRIIFGNGSNEIIDLIIRAFCEPGQSNVIQFSPTYGIYSFFAEINNVSVIDIKLQDDFSMPPVREIDSLIKCKGVMFICSPNNPTGNRITLDEIRSYANSFYGIVAVDEAYIDYSNSPSAVELIKNIPNLIVIQTFSKGMGMAAIRLGVAFANPKVIEILEKIKPPYNVNTLTQQEALFQLENLHHLDSQVNFIKRERERLSLTLNTIPIIKQVYPSETNFLLVKLENAKKVYQELLKESIVVRDKSDEIDGCLRITIGTSKLNDKLIKTLKSIS